MREVILNGLSKKYEVAQEPETAFAYAYALWVKYALNIPSRLSSNYFDNVDSEENRAVLLRSNYVVSSVLRKNPSSLKLFWARIFLEIELGHLERANEALDRVYSYRRFYRSKRPKDAAVLYFLYALLEIAQKRLKSAEKHIRSLSAFSEASQTQTFIGFLRLRLKENDLAYEYFANAYANGDRSPLLYIGLGDVFLGRLTKTPDKFLLFQVMRWLVSNNSEKILTRRQVDVMEFGDDVFFLAKEIYKLSQNSGVLCGICRSLLARNDNSAVALEYYKDAQRKQLDIKNLNSQIVIASFYNNAENVSRFIMTSFLIENDLKNAERDFKIFIYHILLTNPALADEAQSKETEILDCARECLEAEIRGRRANSLYYFFWIKTRETDKKISGICENILRRDLTAFELTANEPCAFVYVNEKERSNVLEFEYPTKGPLVINAVSPNFDIATLDSGRKKALQTSFDIKRRVASARPSLYLYFYNKGFRSFEICAYLARLKTDEEQNFKISDEQNINILEDVMRLKISDAFRAETAARLGALYYKIGDVERALERFSIADEALLNGDALSYMVKVYEERKIYGLCANIIERRQDVLEPRLLFSVAKTLAKLPEYKKRIAGAAYSLLISGKFSQELLDAVIEFHERKLDDWLELSDALENITVYDRRLDLLILERARFIRRFDSRTGRIFARRVQSENFEKNSAASEFALMFAERVIRGLCASNLNSGSNSNNESEKISSEALKAFEWLVFSGKLKEKDRNRIIIALAYLEGGTLCRPQILKEALKIMQNERILFPGFASSVISESSFTQEYAPFIYATSPNKDVRLYFRADGDDEWRTRKTNYWGFGVYGVILPRFHKENISYYFSEETPTGSISTRETELTGETAYLNENSDETFFIINNAVIYEKMFRYEKVEEIITELLEEVPPARAKLKIN